MSAAARKYLERYAHPACKSLTDFPQMRFARALAIPCYNESPEFVRGLLDTTFEQRASTLVCLVVNQPLGSQSQTNQQLISFLKQWPQLWQRDNLSLLRAPANQQYYLLANFTAPGLPTKQGVGLARKIAADLMCLLWFEQKLEGPWLHCTDADAHLPSNYFTRPEHNCSAAVFDFSHRPAPENPQLTLATTLYERAIKYYAAGLQWAGSRYGFNTIGSCIAVNLEHYCLVRGFPTRSAAEDFYLLNKLAKVGQIEHLAKVRLQIDSRLSDRVPFGTGPAVAKIMDLAQPVDDYLYYAPECFFKLKEALRGMARIIEYSDRPTVVVKQDFDPIIAQGLEQLHIGEFIAHLSRQSMQAKQAAKALHDWFDGFKTLKFLRYLQTHYYPAVPLSESLQRAPFSSI